MIMVLKLKYFHEDSIVYDWNLGKQIRNINPTDSKIMEMVHFIFSFEKLWFESEMVTMVLIIKWKLEEHISYFDLNGVYATWVGDDFLNVVTLN